MKTPIMMLLALSLVTGCASMRPAHDFDAVVAAYESMNDSPFDTDDDGWSDVSPERAEQQRRDTATLYARLQSVDAARLDEDRRVSHAVLDYLLRSQVELGAFPEERLPFLNDSGYFTGPAQRARNLRLRTVEDAEQWIARLEALPAWFNQQQAWLQEGIDTGWTQAAHIMPGVIDIVRTMSEGEPADSILYRPFSTLPDSMPTADRERLQAAGLTAVREHVLPAYRGLLAFLENAYLPAARVEPGIHAVPDGRDYYRALVRMHTTLDTTPEEVHQRGLAEVARIRAEMETIIAQVEFEGSFAEFVHFMRTDPRFYAQTEEELMMRAAWLSKRADDQMPRFFNNLPRLPYGVRPVPPEIAPTYTTGRYWPGNLERGVAGGYMVNTYALDQRPLYELPSLTVHEAVPGHHHQVAISQELEGVPEYRRRSYITAFGEGWGLYTEFLAIEMGMYDTPYDHFGRLTFEMWRACRLVVDTGLHWYGWSVEQAEACLLENSALAPHNVRTEVARYVSWPGQALAYKTGELLIRDLRRQAEERLGEDFDLRAFHDHLLAEGAMPLSALEARMLAWIAAQE